MPVASFVATGTALAGAFGRLLAAKRGSLPHTPSFPKTRHTELGDTGKDR